MYIITETFSSEHLQQDRICTIEPLPNLPMSERSLQGASLRRPLGGRLRVYRPFPSKKNRGRHLDSIRKALVRGELSLNGFNRWRLIEVNKSAVGWTFVETGHTSKIAQTEIQTALRESGDIQIIEVNEQSADDVLTRLKNGGERPDLVVIQRDWINHPGTHSVIARIISVGKIRGFVIHIIAALGSSSQNADPLHKEARQRYLFDTNPLIRVSPTISRVEQLFGESLSAAGLEPIPQKSVANYFLDFAVMGNHSGLPLRLDVEVDGRYWHEELAGRRRPSDDRRDYVLKCFGWRPMRFWTDEIEEDEKECIERILNELKSV